MLTLLLAMALTQRDTTTMGAALQRQLAAAEHPQVRWGDISDVRDAVSRGYALRGWRPMWTVDGRLTLAARRVLLELDSAATRGLDPADYDAARLEARVDSLPMLDATGLAEFDMAMSIGAARFASALNRGRIDPHVMHPMLPRLADSVDLAATLDLLSRSPRPDTVLRNLEPHHATYQRLLDVLADYRQLTAASATPPDDSIAPRLRQIELALERWRWLPHSAAAPWVLVNVPAFQLYALTSDREELADTLKMHVIAGRAATHPTPLLVTNIVAVQFHPPWVVPPLIATREIRPLAQHDSAFLRRQHYDLLRGDTIVPATPENVLHIGGAVVVRQQPGPWNALGRIKFVTPNDAAVFLHDTPDREDFGLARRDLSHGCIRVAAPVALAQFALLDLPEWTPERIAAALADSATLVVTLPHPIPVFVIYQTLVPRESGGIIVYPDIYGFDRRLDQLLRTGYPFAAAAPVP